MKSNDRINQVTPVSRVLAAVIFVILPFIGFWIGFTYQNELNDMYKACTEMRMETTQGN